MRGTMKIAIQYSDREQVSETHPLFNFSIKMHKIEVKKRSNNNSSSRKRKKKFQPENDTQGHLYADRCKEIHIERGEYMRWHSAESKKIAKEFTNEIVLKE